MNIMVILHWIAIIMMICGFLSFMGTFYFYLYFSGITWFMTGAILKSILDVCRFNKDR